MRTVAAKTRTTCRISRGDPGALTRVFPARRSQVAEVRRFVGAAIGDFASADDVVLCASELATNAVVHGSPGDAAHFMVQVRRPARRRVYVSVTDRGARRTTGPRLADAGDDAEGFRGLAMVDALATAWGAVPLAGGGYRVWFEVVVP